jgi:hypothetical protein
MTRFLLLLAAALCAAPAALADGGGGGVLQNGDGLLATDGTSRTVAIGTYDDTHTTLARISTSTGVVQYSLPLLGAWGIPYVVYTRPEGQSADGRTLVLAQASMTYPRPHSSFLVLDARSFRVRHGITLQGEYEYDGLSPDGKRLYLIQRADTSNVSRYVVRAYDLTSLRLLPGRIADRTQRSWVMEGYPVDRVATADGRWVYTLYANPGGFPFVHALDTVRGVAHCTGLPWHGSDTAPYNLRLDLHGTTLHVHWLSGRKWQTIDTRTHAVSPDRSGGFPWWTLSLLALLPLAVAALRWRRDRAPGSDEVLQDPAGAGRRGARHRRLDRNRRDGGAPRPERRREVDDPRHAARPAAAGRGHGQGLRDTAG